MEVDSFEKIKILGEGTYGKCYLVVDRKSQELCVLKQIEIFGMSEEEINEAVREAHIL
jgi:serine/threonine protein kinase